MSMTKTEREHFMAGFAYAGSLLLKHGGGIGKASADMLDILLVNMLDFFPVDGDPSEKFGQIINDFRNEHEEALRRSGAINLNGLSGLHRRKRR